MKYVLFTCFLCLNIVLAKAQTVRQTLVSENQLNAQTEKLDMLNGGQQLYWQHGLLLESAPLSGEYKIVCPDKSIHHSDRQLACDRVKLHLKIDVQHALDCRSSNGSISIRPSLGSAPYTFQWSNGAMNPDLDQLSPGRYSCTITDRLGNTETMRDIVIRALDSGECTQKQNDVVDDFDVYPNPASNQLTLNINGSYTDAAIIDSNGKKIKEIAVADFVNQRILIPLEGIPSGIYWISLTHIQKGSMAKKIFIQR